MGLSDQNHAPSASPPGKTRYPLYVRLGGHQGQLGRVRKISPLLGFDLRTVQPVASRYTDWAMPAHHICLVGHIFHIKLQSNFIDFVKKWYLLL